MSERTQDGNGDESKGGEEPGTGTGVETRGRTQDGNTDETADGNGSSRGDGNGDGDGNEDVNGNGIGDGKKGNQTGEGSGRRGQLWYPPHREISRVEDQALSFRTRYPLRR